MIFGKHLNKLSSPQIKVATSAAAATTTTTSNVCQGFAANINWYILFDLNFAAVAAAAAAATAAAATTTTEKGKGKETAAEAAKKNNNNNRNNNTNINSCFSGLCSRQKLLLVSPALAVHPPACT